MKYLKFGVIITLWLSVIPQSFAQQTLQEKYNEMLESTETYEQYKVIPRARLNGFWNETVDSLKTKSATISDLKSQVSTQQLEINSLKSQMTEIESKLNASLELNDTIYFLGIPFSKLGYHLMVWAIIIILAALGAISYMMFMRSNTVTSKTKKECEKLEIEFEDHKTKAREKQVKLKRELQTAVNQLNERRG